jgi:hypothetical protein
VAEKYKKFFGFPYEGEGELVASRRRVAWYCCIIALLILLIFIFSIYPRMQAVDFSGKITHISDLKRDRVLWVENSTLVTVNGVDIIIPRFLTSHSFDVGDPIKGKYTKDNNKAIEISYPVDVEKDIEGMFN